MAGAENGKVWSGTGKTQEPLRVAWIFFEDELMLKDECILVNYMDEAAV